VVPAAGCYATGRFLLNGIVKMNWRRGEERKQAFLQMVVMTPFFKQSYMLKSSQYFFLLPSILVLFGREVASVWPENWLRLVKAKI
jgi:hypothetical protein